MAGDERWSTLLLGAITVSGIESFERGFVRVRVTARTLPGRQFEVARELRFRLGRALNEAGIATHTALMNEPAPP